MTEALVSSFLLFMTVVLSLALHSDSLQAFSRARAKDKRMAEISSINENVRHEVSKWRRSSNQDMSEYDMDESRCGDNMASLLLEEMQIQTPNTLEAKGRFVISKNDGFPDATIYLPQSGWCP